MMIKLLPGGIVSCVLFAASVFGQTPAPSFEVASIKFAPDLTTLGQQVMAGKAHLGIKIDGHRVDIGAMSLRDLISYSWNVPPFQVSGPDWMILNRFDILAILPEGADKEQVPRMMQWLLAERFKLTVHRENKEHPIYALVVGKNGSKLKPSPPEIDPQPAAPGDGAGTTVDTGNGPARVKTDGKGGTTVTTAANGTIRATPGESGAIHIESSRMSMFQLATQLTSFVDRPVIDMTELKGNWQVAVDIPMQAMLNATRAQGIAVPSLPGTGQTPDAASDPSGGNAIFESVQKLGLKLDPRKQTVEQLIVDHLEKAPTEN